MHEELYVAIARQAMEDYMVAKGYVMGHNSRKYRKECEEARWVMRDCERYLSGDFCEFMDMEPEVLMEALDRRVERVLREGKKVNRRNVWGTTWYTKGNQRVK